MSEANKSDATPQQKRSKFDCNICFDSPKDPVVTLCGHLYCWSCLSKWLQRECFECPVCKAGVTRDNVIPIYGQEFVDPRYQHVVYHRNIFNSAVEATSEPGERPRAHRVEAPESRRRRSWTDVAGSTFSFRFFPLGVGFTFRAPGNWFSHSPESREEQVSQALSLLFLFVGIFVTIWILVMGGGAAEF